MTETLQISDESGELDSWPAALQALILPGTVGLRDKAYPPTTSDLVKRLQSAGLRVDYLDPAPHPVMVFDAAEWWFPFILFAGEAVASGATQVLIDAVKDVIGSIGPRDRMHLKVGVVKADGRTYRAYEISGLARDVLAAVGTLQASD